MRTLNFKNLTTLLVGALIGLSVACDKKSGDSAPAPAPAPVPVQSYGYVNGVCRELTTQTVVAANLCTTVANGSYRWNGTQCLDLNNQAVDPLLCQNSGISGNYRYNGFQCVDVNNLPVAQQLCAMNPGLNGYRIQNGSCYTNQGDPVTYTYCAGVAGYVAGQCNGWYVQYRSYMTQYLYCSGTSCSGQTLLEAESGRPIACP